MHFLRLLLHGPPDTPVSQMLFLQLVAQSRASVLLFTAAALIVKYFFAHSALQIVRVLKHVLSDFLHFLHSPLHFLYCCVRTTSGCSSILVPLPVVATVNAVLGADGGLHFFWHFNFLVAHFTGPLLHALNFT